ncbi:MAG: GNAT family N-acetyltransferase [Zoogloea sp.]|uniref:GNAT family N-acetyltransferase n=1 Tax=Zoogloea sp. TaxID=49181 RepID=UPI002626F6A1|nr:GNAT family N-acetyltransferase [Zoogloea sp.]MDD3328412.1 GNAT family N-acetyltransferase [Zoogloea sp.]
MEIALRLATGDDAEAIAGLVNRAYRPGAGLRGWTHEAELVAGARASGEMVRALLRPGSAVLVLCRGVSIVACVHVEANPLESSAYIGMLATEPAEPAEQAGGLGKRMLACAERYAAEELGARVFRMSVLVARVELMAFYLRRGYVRSGRLEGFPDDAGAGVPRVPGLQLETLVKQA